MKNQADEQYIIELIREGKANKEIAAVVHKPVRTLEGIVYRLMRKYKCRNRVELAIKGIVPRDNV